MFIFIFGNLVANNQAFGRGVYEVAPDFEKFVQGWINNNQAREASAQEIGDYLLKQSSNQGSGAPGQTFAPKEIEFETDDDLNPGEQTTGSITLGKLFIMTNARAESSCRVRIYRSQDHAAQDQTRARGESCSIDCGLVCEFVFDADMLDLALSPLATGATAENPRIGDYPIIVENLSDSAQNVSLVFTVISLEN